MTRVLIGKDSETGQPVWLGDVELWSGLYILGRPGMGKSTLATLIAVQDTNNNPGYFSSIPTKTQLPHQSG